MEAYQRFHDNTKNVGEYIVLNGGDIINNAKMPKNRAWHYNRYEQYFGSDILSKSSR